jgi:hypothetical protein
MCLAAKVALLRLSVSKGRESASNSSEPPRIASEFRSLEKANKTEL